jgi:hypothetical protein
MNWGFIIIAYLLIGIAFLVGVCALDDISDANIINTPIKRILVWLLWGVIYAIFCIGLIPFVIYKLIKDGLN